MRIKSLAAAVGLSVVAAVTLGQGVSSANRGSSDPVTEPAIELPVEPVEEAPAPAPAPEEETPAPPAEEETPVVEEPPAPTTTTTAPPAAPAPKPVTVPVVEPAPVVTLEKKKADPAPAPAKPEPAPKADPCHMDSYEPVDVEDLSGDERARADKVDRNDNGVVCRKDIPNDKGRGNTGQNSNIKDDQVR